MGKPRENLRDKNSGHSKGHDQKFSGCTDAKDVKTSPFSLSVPYTMLIHLIFVISLLPFTLGQSYVVLAQYNSADCADGSIQSVKAFPTGCSLYLNNFNTGIRESIKVRLA